MIAYEPEIQMLMLLIVYPTIFNLYIRANFEKPIGHNIYLLGK